MKRWEHYGELKHEPILGTTYVQTCGLSMSTLVTIILPESSTLYYFYLFAYYTILLQSLLRLWCAITLISLFGMSLL
ncbi:hypothetical protein GIB67_017282 [Kingdonia uniflora]|uniref:Uncharacterized protein n=1 Tax=Kingdonia uniflora TaxID=39325 RepID=A0A7J7N3J8_9MAGN|nr:hypothetical protein GIB67_017282 [Kingdonia uniflora]